MLVTRKEIQVCKDQIQRAHQLVTRICDSTGCVAVKATLAGRVFLFYCSRKTCKIGTVKLGMVLEFQCEMYTDVDEFPENNVAILGSFSIV